MGIFGSHPGSWFGLPDFGLTEKIGDTAGLPRNKQGGSELAYTPSQIQKMSGSVVNAPVVNWSPSQRQIVPSTGGGNNGSVQGSSSTSSIRDLMLSGKIPWDDNILNAGNNGSNQVDDFNVMIESDYNSAMNQLSEQESSLRSQADYATGAIDTSYGPTKTAIGAEQTTREAGLSEQEATANKTAASTMSDARRLFQETQQSNIAQLSGLGISSSSVTEALAERLGVETARRIAGITGSRDEIINNISKERTNVRTYYQKRMTDLENEMSNQKSQIQNSLLQGISQINASRYQAQSDKSNRRAEVLRNAQNAMAELEKNRQNFEYSLKLWAMEQQNSLAGAKDYTLSTQDFTTIAKNLEGFGTTGVNNNYDISATYKPNSGMNYSFTTKKKTGGATEYDPEDPNSWQ